MSTPVRLSHSTLELFNRCQREYYLTRVKSIYGSNDSLIQESDKNNINLDFGRAYGRGLAKLLETHDLELAIWEALISYNFAEFDDKVKNELSLITCLQAFYDSWDFDEWELLEYQGKPATELSFKIIINEATGDYYCGYIDAVMRNKISGVIALIEAKTTKYKMPDLRPLYINSFQGLGYGIILDAVMPEMTSWTVFYAVAQLKGSSIIPTMHLLPFTKTKQSRLEWLLTLQADYEREQEYRSLDFWPMRGNGCFRFGRECPLLGVCNLDASDYDDAPEKPEDDWDIVLTAEDLLTHLLQAA